jgi:hypothetical protein
MENHTKKSQFVLGQSHPFNKILIIRHKKRAPRGAPWGRIITFYVSDQ